jgi:hypothetical protein
MMKRLAGVLAGAALLGGLALANQDTVGSSPSTQAGSASSSELGKGGGGTTGIGTGGSGQGQVPGVASGQIADTTTQGSQLIGTVVESRSHTLYLQHMGAVVPLRVDKDTRLDGLSGKTLTDLKSGDEVQVTFTVRNRIENVATRISLPSATGGSGLGTSEESRDTGSGIGGSGSAEPGSTGEDSNVGRPGRPVYPEEDLMKQPMDTSREHHSEQKPIY